MNRRINPIQPKVLVSFQDPAELAMCDGVLIDIYDLKAPSRGPLGRPDLDMAKQFLGTLGHGCEASQIRAAGAQAEMGKPRFSGSLTVGKDLGRQPASPLDSEPSGVQEATLGKTSLALGEWREWRQVAEDSELESEWLKVIRQFRFAKFGLAGVESTENSFCEQWHQFQSRIYPTQLVPVWYADHHKAGMFDLGSFMTWVITVRQAWSRLAVEKFSPVSQCRFHLLVDTFQKVDNSGVIPRLRQFISSSELEELCEHCRGQEMELVVAGSVRLGDLDELFLAGVQAVGVRGAVCCDSGRTNRICRDRLREFVNGVKRRT